MKISELINSLQYIKDNYGDILVIDEDCYPVDCTRVRIPSKFEQDEYDINDNFVTIEVSK
jgi:hypothetical protein